MSLLQQLLEKDSPIYYTGTTESLQVYTVTYIPSHYIILIHRKIILERYTILMVSVSRAEVSSFPYSTSCFTNRLKCALCFIVR